MSKPFVRPEDVHSKLHDCIVLVKDMPFWLYYLNGMNVLAVPLFDWQTDVPEKFWSDIPQSEHKAHDFINGTSKAFTLDANSPTIDLSVPDFGYVNVFNHAGKKPTFDGVVWVSRRTTRSSVYGIHQSVVVERAVDVFRPVSVWSRTHNLSWGDALMGRFPSIVRAKEMLADPSRGAVAFDKHFCLARPNPDSPVFTIHYNDTKVAILGKKLRLLPMWNKPWFEKLLSRHTFMVV